MKKVLAVILLLFLTNSVYAENIDNCNVVSTRDNLSIVECNSRYGLFDVENNKYLLNPIYDNITNDTLKFFSKDVFLVSQNGYKGLVGRNGEFILEPEYEEIVRSFVGFNGLLVKKDNKYGSYNIRKHNYFLEPIYDSIEFKRFKNLDTKDFVYVYVVKKEGKVKLLDYNADTIVDYRFEDITDNIYSNRLGPIAPKRIKVKENGKYGIYDLEADTYVIEPKFDMIFGFNNMRIGNKHYYEKILWVTTSGNKKGLLEAGGNLLLETEYDNVVPFDNNNRYVKVLQGNKFALYDTKKQKLSKFIYDDIYTTKLGDIVVVRDANKDLYNPIKATLKTTGLVLVGIPLSPLVFVSPTMGIVQLMTSE